MRLAPQLFQTLYKGIRAKTTYEVMLQILKNISFPYATV
jgi:hypothetical protein